MTRILACGEGSHDIGSSTWDKKTGTETHNEGWMQPVIRKICSADKIEPRLIRDLKALPSRSLIPKPKGLAYKAGLARLVAALEKFDIVVFMADADTNLDRERSARVDEIRSGFTLVETEAKGKAHGVPCVPKSASEAWMLSDSEAWREVGLDNTNVLPRGCPEDLWGERKNPAGNHPKHAFARAADAAGVSDDRETRRLISAASDLQTLRNRCPTSFSEFDQELQECCVRISAGEKQEEDKAF